MGSGKSLREAKERPLELRKKIKVTCLRGRRGRMERFKQAPERARGKKTKKQISDKYYGMVQLYIWFFLCTYKNMCIFV